MMLKYRLYSATLGNKNRQIQKYITVDNDDIIFGSISNKGSLCFRTKVNLLPITLRLRYLEAIQLIVTAPRSKIAFYFHRRNSYLRSILIFPRKVRSRQKMDKNMYSCNL